MYDKSKTVIVYLAMNTKKDESYGRDSRSMLEKSLDSLYKFYNNKFNHDIIIFYDNKFPFGDSDQKEIIKGRKEISFRLLDGKLWSPPDCLEIKKNPDPKKWVDPIFPVGYRNMMRWYGILIYEYLTNLGYEWYMRMDDDSLLHSNISYDIFEYMANNDYEYGFRSYCNDHIMVSNGLIEFCKSYVDNENIKPAFLDRYIRNNKVFISKDYNILGYYNNFLISKLSFWMRKDVQKFLSAFDNSGFQYTKRWNDLISQAVTIQIFMDRNKVYHFKDWDYEHTTFSGNYDSKQSIAWGGFYPKTNECSIISSKYADEWVNKYNFYNINTFDTYDVKDCLKKTDDDIAFCSIINNDVFDCNGDNSVNYLGCYNNLNDIYLRILDHWLNCYTWQKRAIQFQYPIPIGFVWYISGHNKFDNRLYVINDCNKIRLNRTSDGIKQNGFFVLKNLFVV